MEKLKKNDLRLSGLCRLKDYRHSTIFNNQMIMEYYAAQKQKNSWGKKPCDHPRLEKEYYSGAFLVNYVCSQCGKEFTIAQKLELDKARKAIARGLP
jgi:transposase-like protein